SITRYLIQLTSFFRLIAPIMRVWRDTFIQIIPKLTVYLSINLSSFYGILEIFFSTNPQPLRGISITLPPLLVLTFFDRRKDAGVNT
ncbi:TPA: hypothetical protein ACIVF9_000413, partial [Salmonella enterica subsp. enterica serovar Typhi]